MTSLFVTAIIGFALINLWTMLRFWQDKQRALASERRFSEADLLWLALIGGSPAALLSRRLFRHKTRKEPFSTYLFIIIALQIGAAVGFFIL